MEEATAGPLQRLAAHRLTLLVVAVVLLGAGLMAYYAITSDASADIGARPGEFLLLAIPLLLCEILPIRVVRDGDVDEIVASTAFTFALLLTFGPAVALACQGLASIVSDVSGRKSLLKTVFNVGQYWVAWGLAAIPLLLVGGVPLLVGHGGIPVHVLGALVASALVFFVVNTSLIGTVVALATEVSVGRMVRTTLRQEMATDWLLLSLGPVLVVVGNHSLLLLPLLLLPILSAYRSAAQAVAKEHQASHDPLTDLPNRLLWNTRLSDALARGRRNGAPLAVLLIDLDRFKEVNDTLGHQAGDALLEQVGPRISEALGDDAVLARLGGDEFAVMIPGADDREAMARAESIVAALERPFPVGEISLDVEASIGVALFPEHGDDPDALLQRADVAMYEAKATQRPIARYDIDRDPNRKHRLSLLADLRVALADDESGDLVLHFQPKVDTRTGRVLSVEALVRWCHPVHGMLGPDQFVGLAEHTGLIRPLTSRVLRMAAAQARAWRDAGISMPVAVNLSARCLHDVTIAGEVAEVLEQYDLGPAALQLEITESSIMTEPGRARRVLGVLASMGIHLSVDDFGTGYSSLAYLQQLPVGEIKIDRSFVLQMMERPSDRVIVQSIIDLGRNLGLHVTAEGVESEAALAWLRDAGCHAAQGFLISRPRPAGALDDVTGWPAPSPSRTATVGTGRPSLALVQRDDLSRTGS